MIRFFWNVCIFILIVLSATSVYAVKTIIGEQIQIDGQMFEIEKPIASGGFGHVYVVRSLRDTDIKYALKIFSHSRERKAFNPQQMRAGRNKAYQKIIQIDREGKQLKFAPRFVKVNIDPSFKLSEAEAAALAGHPSKDLVIVMPLAKSDLQDLVVVSSHSVPERINLAMKVIDDVMPELALLANNDLVHNDIKLENILVTQDGRLGLADFDTVVRAGATMPFNTPYFLAPERQGRNVSAPVYPISDIYSLGIVAGLIVAPRDENHQTTVDVRDSEVFSAYLDQLEIEISLKYPALKESFARVKQFLDASLDVVPATRLEKLSQFTSLFTTGRMKERRGNDRHSQDIDLLRKALSNLDHAAMTQKYLADIKRNMPDIQQLLTELAKENSLYIEAFLLAARLDIELPNGKNNFYSKLRSAPFREIRQIDNLKAFLNHLSLNGTHKLDAELLKILLQRFILPKGANLAGHEDIIRMISLKPEVPMAFSDVLLPRLGNDPASETNIKMAQLFVNSDVVPNEVTRVWLETIVSQGTTSSVSALTYEAIKKIKWIPPALVESFLFSVSDQPTVLYQKLRLLSALLLESITKVNFTDPRFSAFLNSTHAHVRWETANLMLENGFKNEIVQDVFIKDGIANNKTSATGRQIQLDSNKQLQVLNTLLTDPRKENVAADMLFRQRAVDAEVASLLGRNLNLGSPERRMLVSFLLLKNESISIALKQQALVAAADILGAPGISSKTILDQIRKSANKTTWSPSFQRILDLRKAQNAIEPDGIYSGPSTLNMKSCQSFYH